MSGCECAYRFCAHEERAVQASTTVEVVGGHVAMCRSCAESACADWAYDVAAIPGARCERFGLVVGNPELPAGEYLEALQRTGRRVICLREEGHRGDCEPSKVIDWYRDRRGVPVDQVVHWDADIRTPRVLVS